MNAEKLWNLIVSVAPPDGRLAFVTDIVTRLAEGFKATSRLSAPLRVGISHGAIAGPELVVYPVGNIGPELLILAEALADSRHQSKFHVAAANVVNVQTEHLAVGRHVPARAGLQMSYDGLPVAVIHGEANHLLLTMEGFERALFGLTAEVPHLWDRVRRARGAEIDRAQAAAKGSHRSAEGQRRQSGAQRNEVLKNRQERSGPIGQLGLTLPAMTIRPIAVSGGDGPVTGNDALLVPIRGQKAMFGDYPMRKVAEMLRAGLGVQTVLADYRLRVLLGDRSRARDELTKALPMTFKHLRKEGIPYLPAWTRFDTTEQVRHWCEAKAAKRPALRNVGQHLIDVELAPVNVLSRALLHAEIIVQAYDQAEGESEVEAAETIGQAHTDSRFATMAIDDLLQVAMLANINPTIFWQLPHEVHSLPFEVARVMGRITMGAGTLLPPHIQDAVRRAIEEGAMQRDPDEPPVEGAIRAIVLSVAELMGRERLVAALDRVAGTGDSLSVARKSGKIRIIAASKRPSTRQ